MYQAQVFLEVRILVSNGTKAFCPCHIGKKTGTCSICRGEAHSVPIINQIAVRRAYTLAHSLDCILLETSTFQKPKGSPSLPEEYSLTGASIKIATDGFMDIEFHRRKKRIFIEEIRMEEDAGRLTHSDGLTKMDYSHAGAPNIRIRTKANIELGEEAEIFLSELRRRIQYTGILKGITPENVIRCNAYVALAQFPDIALYSVKLRNLNSFNFVRKAINAELHRQEELLTAGQTIVSESRLWNERQDRTEFFQSREEGSRLITEKIEEYPDFICPPALLAELRASVAERPSERQVRLIQTLGLNKARAEFICDEKSRADFFEETIAYGAAPVDTAHWLMSEVIGILRKTHNSIAESPLSPKRFARILELYNNRIINNKIARLLLQAVIESDKDPDLCLKENAWNLITDQSELSSLVKKVILDNPTETKRIQEGDFAPIEFLVGLIMKKTKGLADPATVKELLKTELKISLIYVLSLGGSITGIQNEGEVSAGDAKILKNMILPEQASIRILCESITQEKLLSEEIRPADWAWLIHSIAKKIASGTANGIVVTHGTDTLSYTAPLIYWLFADSPVPIVFTASNTVPSLSLNSEFPDEARLNFNKALKLANEKDKGIYVVFGDKVLSPCNLKFLRPTLYGFTNWNNSETLFTGTGLLSEYQDTDPYVMTQILAEAADRFFLCRVHPGMRADRLLALTEHGVNRFILELYEKGTGNMKESPYSLKALLIQGRKRGCKFYCTSQQEGIVDFSGFSTSRRMWREGAMPMGSLTTETVVALYFAASLVSDSDEELDDIMESFSSL